MSSPYPREIELCGCTGLTVTELFRANCPEESAGEQRYLNGVPIKRFGKQDEISATIAVLMSENARLLQVRRHMWIAVHQLET